MSFLYSGLYTGCSRTSLETEIKTAVRLAKLVTERSRGPVFRQMLWSKPTLILYMAASSHCLHDPQYGSETHIVPWWDRDPKL